MPYLYVVALIIAVIGAFMVGRTLYKAGYNKRKCEDLEREKNTNEQIAKNINAVDNLSNDAIADILQNITDKHDGNMSNKA